MLHLLVWRTRGTDGEQAQNLKVGKAWLSIAARIANHFLVGILHLYAHWLFKPLVTYRDHARMLALWKRGCGDVVARYTALTRLFA
jgi:hypothetical protein